MPNYFIQTYGCQMNYSDTERMESYLRALGLKKAEEMKGADLIIFNTCSIRQKAEDRVLGQMKKIRKLRKNNQALINIIAGCMVRTASSRYSTERDKLFNRIPELDIALRTEELPKLAKLIREINPNSKIKEIPEENLEDYFKIDASHSTHHSKTQAFVPVSNGCDKFCTYCIVPYSRGREKSRSFDQIIKECEELIAKGIKEITLIGQTVNSYGLSKSDKESNKFKGFKRPPFVILLEKLDELHDQGLERVRWTSPHPKDMSDELIEAMASLKTQMPYLHLPVQAGDDEVLKRMNRTYSTDQYRKIIKKLRKHIPCISITTDIIVGFCGETDKEFENTYEFFEEMGFEHAYIAQYSERKGTTAQKFMKDDIPPATKKERWERLNALIKKQSEKALKRFKGKEVNVLVETQEKGICEGRSEHFKTVEFTSQENLLGQIVPIKITEAREWILKGNL